MPTQPPHSPTKILIAEDNKVTQTLYKQGLPSALCEIKIAGDGEEALEIYKEWHPDIVLLDYGMPILNGFLVLKAIRERENDKQTTIIMVTSMVDKEYILACAKVGIQGYIVKPFKTSEIAKKIFELYKKP